MLKNDEEIFNEKARQLSDLKKENAQMVSAECTFMFIHFTFSRICFPLHYTAVMGYAGVWSAYYARCLIYLLFSLNLVSLLAHQT